MSNHTTEGRAPAQWRWPAGLGIVFAILYALGFLVLSGSQPGFNAAPAHVVSYYNAHHNSTVVGTLAIFLAAVAFGFFAAGVRAIVAANDRSGQLATAVTVGAAVFISGLLLMTATQTALVDAAHHHQAQSAQVLNDMSQDSFFPVVGGLAIFMIAAGVAVIRAAALPSWLGWLVAAVGVLAVAGPLGGIAFLLAPVVVVIAAVTMLAQKCATPRLIVPARSESTAPMPN